MRHIILFNLISLLLLSTVVSAQESWKLKLDQQILGDYELNINEMDYLVFLENQLEFHHLNQKSKTDKARFVYNQLKRNASLSQESILKELSQNNIFHQSYFLVNCIRVKSDHQTLRKIAQKKNVLRISANTNIALEEVQELNSPIELRTAEPEWGIKKIQADSVWSLGIRGQGVVIGGQDTGFDWENSLIQSKYRGYNESSSDHNYNWHDAIREISPLHNDSIVDPSNNPCGLDIIIPCDDHGHGSHTMGTMVGEDDDNSIGVAPASSWIACRNMERGWGKPSTYLECFEWFLAPTDLNGENPDPSKAPHVINNSWSCPQSEGCDSTNWFMMDLAVNNLKSSGIVVVVSAGNNGSNGCGSISRPAAMFENSFTIGATAENDTIAGFSSRGMVSVDSSFRLKPNVSAPGVAVRSIKLNNEFGTWSGTSMAGPHVAGTVALMISANPSIAGDVEAIETILELTADPKTTDEECHGVPGSEVPNPVYGYGRINALAAVEMAMDYVSGTNSVDDEFGIQVFPNPITDRFSIISPNVNLHESLNLYDLQGKLLMTIPTNKTRLDVNVSPLSSGVYILSTEVEGKIWTQKIIKH